MPSKRLPRKARPEAICDAYRVLNIPREIFSKTPKIDTEHQRTMSIVHVTDDTFDTKVLKSSRPVLVDFWAEWCGPCKAIAPILEQISVEYQDRLEIAKVDVEGAQTTAMKYGIRSIPTLILFKGGIVEAQHVGIVSKEQLQKLLEAKL